MKYRERMNEEEGRLGVTQRMTFRRRSKSKDKENRKKWKKKQRKNAHNIVAAATVPHRKPLLFFLSVTTSTALSHCRSAPFPSSSFS